MLQDVVRIEMHGNCVGVISTNNKTKYVHQVKIGNKTQSNVGNCPNCLKMD